MTPDEARLVAIGGGHGLAATLRAIAPWAANVAAVVSTADDGGSTGRLRESWDVPALGDVRRCLAALADPNDVWTRVLERRFDAGELSGHAVGNLVLLALIEELGDLQSACDEVARAYRIDRQRARVIPVTDDAIVLHGRTLEGTPVVGQVAVAETDGLDEVWVDPVATAASNLAIEAILRADLVLLGPGSLFTSVLAAVVVGDVRGALADATAPIVYLANLRADATETRGYDVATHVETLHRHGVRPDIVLVQPGSIPLGPVTGKVVDADVAADGGLVHDPAKLARALQALLA